MRYVPGYTYHPYQSGVSLIRWTGIDLPVIVDPVRSHFPYIGWPRSIPVTGHGRLSVWTWFHPFVMQQPPFYEKLSRFHIVFYEKCLCRVKEIDLESSIRVILARRRSDVSLVHHLLVIQQSATTGAHHPKPDRRWIHLLCGANQGGFDEYPQMCIQQSLMMRYQWSWMRAKEATVWWCLLLCANRFFWILFHPKYSEQRVL